MKYIFTFCCALFALTSANAQFSPSEDDLMIIVSDGTVDGKNSKTVTKKDIPDSYDQVTTKGVVTFTDPIRSLGMTDCIQAAAFLERPKFGKTGYMLIFSINDSIGGKQATLNAKDGQSYQGVYRIIRQKTNSDEPVPAGMTGYMVSGTFFLLGMS
ncbi:MAG: hypothetical protein ACI85O_002795 [Saprospiraceae bacterium]|jgi:hypothetical protein